jgi:DHA2 family lincomycin resistance protein-like MFS transporter
MTAHQPAADQATSTSHREVSDPAHPAGPDRDDPTGTTTLPPGAALTIGLLVISASIMILNETIMGVALPALIADLSISVTVAQWLTSGFMLTMAVVIPVTGYLLQRLSARAVYLTSMVSFSLGTLLAALSPSFALLMTGRVIQACGTAVMIPLLMTSIMRLVPPARLGATMGTITIVIAVAPAIGPTLSGVILSVLSWQWTFWLVLPLALAALAAGARWLRVTTEPRRVPLDLLSVGLSVLAFGGLVFGLSSVGDQARGAALVSPWAPTVLGAVALAIFTWRQLRLQADGRALLNLRPLGFRSFTVSLVLMMLTFMSLFGTLILLPLYLQEVLRVSAFVTGLAVLPGGLVMGLLGPVVGRFYDRLGARPLVPPGAVLLAIALWLFATVDASSPLLEIVGLHVLLVVGISFMMTPLMTDALRALPTELDSHGSAIVSTLQQVAGAAGTALFITMLALGSRHPTGGVDVAGARVAFLSAAVIATIALPVTLLIGRRPAAQSSGQPSGQSSGEGR